MTFKVLSESDTVRLILKYRMSCARWGDGELGLALCEASARGQDYSPDLGKALRRAAKSDLGPNLLVCIPRIYEYIPPEKFRWERWATPERSRLWQPGRIYGSAFISRGDWEPFPKGYWRAVRSIWAGRQMLLVTGDENKVAELYDTASSIETLACPPRNAWSEYGRILDGSLKWASSRPDGIVVAQAGPTATVLAFDCARNGVRCIDAGKMSRFYRDEMLKDAA